MKPFFLLLLAYAAVAASPPGVVIDSSPASTQSYIGSPSIAVLPNGDYVASHDFFGPASSNNRSAVFGSTDRGATWRKLAELDGQWWSTLFVHRGALFLLGTTKEYGAIVIRRSDDGGRNWTGPVLLCNDGQYHCAPVPVVVHDGRLWRAFEKRDPPTGWGVNFCAGMLSAPVGADLLNPTNWTASNFLRSEGIGGWLEGNAVVTRSGQLLDVLRVDTAGYPEQAALVKISADGKTASFDRSTGFISFPGGAKKFTIRYDPKTDLYWSLTTIVPEQFQRGNPGSIRNTLALTSSPDLTHWSVCRVLLQHPDTKEHGFQYVDWLIDGEDIIAVCRTAWDGAHNSHDANFLTFHRIANFRTDQPPNAASESTPAKRGRSVNR